MFARSRLPGRSPALRKPRWYWTISVSSELWLEPARCARRESSRSSAWFIACRRSVRLAKVLVFNSEPRRGKASVSCASPGHQRAPAWKGERVIRGPGLERPREASVSSHFNGRVGLEGGDVRCAGRSEERRVGK